MVKPPPQLTRRQQSLLDGLPDDHKVVGYRQGSVLVRRPDGRLLQVQPNGHSTPPIERVRSYLRVGA